MITVKHIICKSSDLKPKKMVTSISLKKLQTPFFQQKIMVHPTSMATCKQVNKLPFLAAIDTVHIRHLNYPNKKGIQVT
jgi:hypothetical protein